MANTPRPSPLKHKLGQKEIVAVSSTARGPNVSFGTAWDSFHKAAGGLCDVSSYSSNEVDGVLQVDVQGLICIDALD